MVLKRVTRNIVKNILKSQKYINILPILLLCCDLFFLVEHFKYSDDQNLQELSLLYGPQTFLLA